LGGSSGSSGGGGAVSYLTFANDAAATAALTQEAGVLQSYNYNGINYTIPNAVIVKKSVGRSDPVKLTTGRAHACISFSDNKLWCQGDNTYGQIGNGGSSPATSLNYTISDVINSSCGHYHTCAVKSDGTVYCWGNNTYGQLGDWTVTPRNSPINVPGLSDVIKISCGADHTAVIKSDGTVYCWGSNSKGQLGDGTTTSHKSPAIVPGLTNNIIQIETGLAHTCALSADGYVYCWGSNSNGQIGDSTTIQRNSPHLIGTLFGHLEMMEQFLGGDNQRAFRVQLEVIILFLLYSQTYQHFQLYQLD
jgi:alpha-tubulin suppressor-like RCC1 family protein